MRSSKYTAKHIYLFICYSSTYKSTCNNNRVIYIIYLVWIFYLKKKFKIFKILFENVLFKKDGS